jgi:Ribbon-helix-helix protein, copG family
LGRNVHDEPGGQIKRITIRIPADMHDALSKHRDMTRKSLNDILIEAIAQLLGRPAPQLAKGIPGPKPKQK